MTDAEQKAFAQGRAAGLEEAAKVCDEIHMDYRDQYKGRGKYHPANPRRADTHCDGMSDGACECAEAIRALSPTSSDAGKDDALLTIARDALEEIALAGMSGSGQESEDGMRDWHARRAWEFIGVAARAKTAIDAAIAAQGEGK